MVVALIQAAIGVTAESIVEEYALSDEPTRRRRAAMIVATAVGRPARRASPALLWTAPAEAMTLFTGGSSSSTARSAEWPAAASALRPGDGAPAP